MPSIRVLLVLIIVALAHAPPAHACSPPPPFSLEGMVPLSGSTGVPTNVMVRVLHGGSHVNDPELKDIVIRPAGGGAALPATVGEMHNSGFGYHRVYVVKLAAQLAPLTSYEVATRIKPSCVYDCISSGYEVLGTFTTGSGPDTTPPVFAGISNLKVSAHYTCDYPNMGACCGEFDGFPFNVTWDPATDDTGIAGYAIYRQGELVSVKGAVGFAQCTGIYSGGPLYDFFGKAGTYEVRAVNLAGNEVSGSATRELTYSCGPGTPDAGITRDGPAVILDDAGVPGPSPDAAPDAAPNTVNIPEVARDDGGGCAVGGRGPAGGGLILLALGVLGTLASRRRRA